MRSWNLLFALPVGVALMLGACDDDGTGPAGPNLTKFVGHDDLGCLATRGGDSLDCLAGATLTRMESSGDTLTFWIRFEANCCPEFTERVAWTGDELTIAVVDTLYACRCVCPFENPFRFLSTGSGPLHLVFESRTARGADVCLSGLDTTVVVP